MPTPPIPATSRRARLSAARAAAAGRRERRRRQLSIAAVTIALLAVAGGVTALLAARPSDRPSPTATVAAVSTLPPWHAPAPGQVPGLVAAAGLPLLAMEATDVHFHAHLDIVSNGRPVVVPADLGIGSDALSPVHTHDATGIVHIEAPGAARFTLGQLFTEWNVTLTRTCIGGLCADAGHQLLFFTNGVPYRADPTGLPLTAHEEIAIFYGPIGQPVSPPSSYPFPAGL
ncbi:MAG: hypothetical protein ACYDAQ_00335 [Mycobacteriales bacterium]